MSELATRWRLKRFGERTHAILLVVEELGVEPRGVATLVTSRADARQRLPQLRQALADRIARLERQDQTFDPVETDG
jgi:hypothetical protein